MIGAIFPAALAAAASSAALSVFLIAVQTESCQRGNNCNNYPHYKCSHQKHFLSFSIEIADFTNISPLLIIYG